MISSGFEVGCAMDVWYVERGYQRECCSVGHVLTQTDLVALNCEKLICVESAEKIGRTAEWNTG